MQASAGGGLTEPVEEGALVKRFLWLLAIVAVLAASCTGNGEQGETDGAAQEEALNLYVVVHGGSGDPYWQIVRNGVEDAGDRFGVNITWLNPEEFSIERLVELMNNAVAANPDGMIATITDAEAVEPPLLDAINGGIPVIAFDVPDTRPEGERIPYLFYIGGDEYLAGQQAAQRMLSEGEVTRAVCAVQEVGNVALELRCDGFGDVMRENDIPVENIDIGTDPTRVQTVLQGYFSANPDTNAVLTLGPQGAIPTIQYFTDNDLWGSVMHATFDLDPTTNESIKAGETLFLIDTQPYLMGYLAVMMMFMHLNYQFNLPEDLLTGPAMIDESNIESVEELSQQRIR
jgi:simple sugar transport system substrate-binding protein